MNDGAESGKAKLSPGCSCVTLSQAHLCFSGFVLLGLLQLGSPGGKNEGLSRYKQLLLQMFL